MKTLMYVTMLFVLLFAFAYPVLASDCEPPSPSCDGPFNAETEGNASTYGLKEWGNATIGSMAEVFGDAGYTAKGTESASGEADSTGTLNGSATFDANSFSTMAHAIVNNLASDVTHIGPSSVYEDSGSLQANGGTVGNDSNYAWGMNNTQAIQNGSCGEDCEGTSIEGGTSAEGDTTGNLESDDYYNKSIINTSGSSIAWGNDCIREREVSGLGEYGAGSYVEADDPAWAGSSIYGTWGYNSESNSSGEGAGGGMTETAITLGANTVTVSSHAESFSWAKTPATP